MEQRLQPPKLCPVCHVAMQATKTDDGVLHRCDHCDLIITAYCQRKMKINEPDFDMLDFKYAG